MSERDLYVEKLKARLDAWNADISHLEARSAEMAADAKLAYERQIAALKASRDAQAEKLHSLREASADAWDALRHGADEAWDAMSKALHDAHERFK